MRRLMIVVTGMLVPLLSAGPALACGGLIGPRGSVNLLRTTTFAGYHQGIEHYVTSFTYTGQGGGKFGSIVPLPGVPTKIERGGDWTLQRLLREVAPPVVAFAARADAGGPAAGSAEVLLETRIDALDITVLKGGGDEVATWARENGFELSPDAPEVLEFYARRSPIFMAARFDSAAAAARGQLAGDGTPIHLAIPTPNPWVPLRILGLGKERTEPVQADVFLLTERAPSLLPAPEGLGSDEAPAAAGLRLERSEAASIGLLRDLNADKGMSWVPTSGMWLSYLRLDVPAGDLDFDLAVDASGFGRPSSIAAGLATRIEDAVAPIVRPIADRARASSSPLPDVGVAALVGVAAGAAIARRRRPELG